MANRLQELAQSIVPGQGTSDVRQSFMQIMGHCELLPDLSIIGLTKAWYRVVRKKGEQ